MATRNERATYSIPEAAEIIGIGLSLCRQLVRKGEIPAKVLGRRMVVPKKALDAWLEQPNNMPTKGGSL
jgi:excisionase family DNA binding protein